MKRKEQYSPINNGKKDFITIGGSVVVVVVALLVVVLRMVPRVVLSTVPGEVLVVLVVWVARVLVVRRVVVVGTVVLVRVVVAEVELAVMDLVGF